MVVIKGDKETIERLAEIYCKNSTLNTLGVAFGTFENIQLCFLNPEYPRIEIIEKSLEGANYVVEVNGKNISINKEDGLSKILRDKLKKYLQKEPETINTEEGKRVFNVLVEGEKGRELIDSLRSKGLSSLSSIYRIVNINDKFVVYYSEDKMPDMPFDYKINAREKGLNISINPKIYNSSNKENKIKLWDTLFELADYVL